MFVTGILLYWGSLYQGYVPYIFNVTLAWLKEIVCYPGEFIKYIGVRYIGVPLVSSKAHNKYILKTL